jgi:hypothetical protein
MVLVGCGVRQQQGARSAVWGELIYERVVLSLDRFGQDHQVSFARARTVLVCQPAPGTEAVRAARFPLAST